MDTDSATVSMVIDLENSLLETEQNIQTKLAEMCKMFSTICLFNLNNSGDQWPTNDIAGNAKEKSIHFLFTTCLHSHIFPYTMIT